MSGVAVLKQVERGEGPVLCAVPDVLAGDALRARVRALMGERGVSQAAVAIEISRSSGAISSWLSNTYRGDIPALETWLRRWVEQQGVQREAVKPLPKVPAWLATPSAEKVLSALRFAHAHGEIGLVYGGAGMGKTATVRHYQDRRNNVWVATMTPAHAGLVSALKGIAAAVGAEVSGNGAEALYREIVRKVERSGGLLVIDEAQHLTVPALEQIRAIHDATGLGIAFVGNERVYAQMAGGVRAAYLAQLRSRIGRTVRLLKAQPVDVEVLMGAWQVNAGCAGALREIAGKPGALRNVMKVLKLAVGMAAGAGRAVAQEDVKAAWGELGGVA